MRDQYFHVLGSKPEYSLLDRQVCGVNRGDSGMSASNPNMGSASGAGSADSGGRDSRPGLRILRRMFPMATWLSTRSTRLPA